MTPRRGALQRVRSLARVADAAAIAAHDVVRGVVEFTDTRVGEFVTTLSPTTARELARRQRERPAPGLEWFTADEAALVEVLAELILPSDDHAPGVAQLAQAGRPAVATLDRLVAGSPHRQAVYARGLLAVDRLAQQTDDRRFVELAPARQRLLLQFVERVQERWTAPVSLAGKVRARIVMLYHKWRGLFAAVELFRTLVRDVLQVFYTDRLSWEWLNYDGPPMPEGYPNVLAPRASVHTEPRRAAE